MMICDVVGSVVATEKDKTLRGQKLLVVQPLDLDFSPQGATLLALDQVDAGEGDRVLVSREGGGARLIFGSDRIPVQAVIVAVIDDLEIDAGAGLIARREN